MRQIHYATGRRKTSSARVYLTKGKGDITVNSKPLRDYLNPIMEHMEDYPISDMIRTHWVTVEGDWNWKCVQDNFNESYHTPYVHPGLKNVAEEKYQECQFDMYESMHSRMLMPGFMPSVCVYEEEDKV